MTVDFAGITNFNGKTIIRQLLDPPPEPLDFYKDTTTNRITSPSTSFSTALPGSVVEDDLLVLYHVTSDDVTQTIVNPVPVTIINPGAESGTANWINQIGSLQLRASSPSPHSGSLYWWGAAQAQVLAYQDIVLPAAFIPEADAGSLTITVGWWQNSRFGDDQAETQIEFYDGFPGSPIGPKILGGIATTPAFNWVFRSFNTAIPPLTRTLRLFMRMVRQTGGNNDGLVDDITLNILGSTTVGWVALWQNVQVTDECTTSCYTKLASATESSTVTVGSTTPEQHVTFISNFGGVDTSNPINAFNNSTNGSASTVVVAPSVITTQGSTMLYVLGAAGGYAEPGDLEDNHWNFSGGVIERAERVVSMDGQKSTLDFSQNAFPVTFAQNAQLDTAIKQSGIASLDMSIFANSQRVTVPDSPLWDLGTADFTLEAHINLIGDFNFTGIISRGSVNNSNKWSFATDTSGRLTFRHDIFFNLTAPASLTGTGWHHVAISRDSGTWRIFTDGVVVATSGTFRNITAGIDPLHIGRDQAQVNRVFQGHIDNVRVSIGIARYTSGFTPPSGLPANDSFTQLLIPFDDPILPFGCKGAVGTEFIPFTAVTGTRVMTIDKAQAAQSGTIAIARQL